MNFTPHALPRNGAHTPHHSRIGMRRLVALGALCLVALAGCGHAAASGASRAADTSGSAADSVTANVARASSVTGATAASSAGSDAASSASGVTRSGSAAGGSFAGDSSTVQIVVIGDSLTSGLATPGYPWTTPAQQILDSANLPAHIVNSSVSGIGYDNDGGVGITFESLVRQVVTARTDIVVLFGSDNDSPGSDLDKAVDSTVDLVRQLAPRATVVIVGPPVTPAQKGADLSGIDSALESAAEKNGATYVDASDWFVGKSSQLLSSDGEHPNDAGEDYLGQKFATLLEPLIRQRLSGN